MVLHRPVEPARVFGMWPYTLKSQILEIPFFGSWKLCNIEPLTPESQLTLIGCMLLRASTAEVYGKRIQPVLPDLDLKIARTVVPFALALFIFATPSLAQGLGKVNVFGGVSFTNYSPIPQSAGSLTPHPSSGLPGWNASLELKPIPIVGILADFSGFYGHTNLVGCVDLLGPGNCGQIKSPVLLHTFLVGPQVSFSVGRFTPFAHALIGAAHVRIGGSFPGNSDTSFAGALGGGIDYRLVPRMALRLQADALETTFSDSFKSTRAGQVNLRGSAGLVIHF